MLRDFFNQRARVWDETVAEKDQSKLLSLVERMHLSRGAAVLDIGTGTGVLLPFLIDAIGPRGEVIGIDFAELMLRRAQAKNSSESVNLLLADAGDIPVSSRRVDAVICYSSFPHFPDKPKALSEMHRVLKAGGRVFLCHTASRRTINRNHRRMPLVRGDQIPSERLIRRILAEAGFCEIVIEDGNDSYLACATRSEF